MKPFFTQKEFRKVYAMIFISIVGLVITFVLLNRMSASSEEIYNLKKEGNSSSDVTTIAFLKEENSHLEDKMNDLRGLFAQQSEIIQFVEEIDRLKREGVIQQVSFVTNDVIKDRSGNYGYPVTIVMSGSEEQVDASLRNIQSLPFLLRGVDTEISREVNEEGAEVINLVYGGFLYVEKLETN